MPAVTNVLKHLQSPVSQNLRSLQPTPTTVSYTVSTRPRARTLSAIVAFYLGIAVRFALGALAVGLLWIKWRISRNRTIAIIRWIGGYAMEETLARHSRGLSWIHLAPGVIFVLWLVLRRGYREESLLVLRGLGLQTSTASSLFFRAPSTRFIPTTTIQDILIHEAFRGFEVRFYLAIIVKDEEETVIVFPGLLPRRAILEEVWRGARACLHNGSSMGTGEKEKRDD